MRLLSVFMTNFVGLTLLSAATMTSAQDALPQNWRTEKCTRYTKAWGEAIIRTGKQGLGAEFISRHEAFLASGCTGEHNVCPVSPQEFDLANIMVIRAMNAGSASTFPPFGCRK